MADNPFPTSAVAGSRVPDQGAQARSLAAVKPSDSSKENNCELMAETPTSDTAPITLRAVSISKAIADMCDVSAHRIFRIQFAGFDRAAYQAMEDTLILASQAVMERFVPIDPVSLALGAKPDVLVLNLGHPDATQLGKTLRPGPGVPVVWVSFAEGNPEVARPGTAVFNSLLKAMQEVSVLRAGSAAA
jgi:hypothetical protein